MWLSMFDTFKTLMQSSRIGREISFKFCLQHFFSDLYSLEVMAMLHRDLIKGHLNMMNHLLLWFVDKHCFHITNNYYTFIKAIAVV